MDKIGREPGGFSLHVPRRPICLRGTQCYFVSKGFYGGIQSLMGFGYLNGVGAALEIEDSGAFHGHTEVWGGL